MATRSALSPDPISKREWQASAMMFQKRPSDLANRVRGEETTIWVPHPARQFIEDGVVKCACPECGHISEMGGFDEVIAYVCDESGAGVDVEPLPESDR
jgi:hypothetical protein